MSLYSDLVEVLTPYANKIKGLAAADDQIKADLKSVKNTVYSRNIDTDIILTTVSESGGYADINNYANPAPNASPIRIRNEFAVSAKKVHIIANEGYVFAYCMFDSNGNMVNMPAGNVLTKNTDVTVESSDISVVRIVIGKTGDTPISPSESLNITIIIDNKPISFSEIYDHFTDKLNAASERLDTIDSYLFGAVYTDASTWVQGGWGAILDYSAPLPNASTTRIRSEFVVNDGKQLKISRSVDGYDFVYACFDSAGNLLEGKNGWQSESIDLPYTNIQTVRVAIRKSDNSNIEVSDYTNSGISVSSDKEMRIECNSPVKLKVMTYNLGRFSYGVSPYYLSNDYDEKLANYKAFFSGQMADIIGLQECNTYLDTDAATGGNANVNSNIFDYLYPYHHDLNGFTCLKSKYPIQSTGTGVLTAGGRQYVYGYITLSGKTIFVMSVHLTPNAGEEQEAKRAQERAQVISILAQHEYAICFGDFNAQNETDFSDFTNAGYKITNGGYLPIVNTYGGRTTFAERVPTDNIVVTPNIIIDNSERLMVFDDLSSDHIPIVAYLTII